MEIERVEKVKTPEADGKKNKLHIRKPKWLRSKIPTGENYFAMKKDVKGKKLFTVCEEAKCPNIGECWNQRSATIMIMGGTCTRACRFCNVDTGNPEGWLDQDEPRQVGRSARELNLNYIVITMVDRDDLDDGGAEHISKVIEQIRFQSPGTKIEILAGDMNGCEKSLAKILEHRPEVFAHNVETVERLSPRVRDARASYRQSLTVLKKIKELADYPVLTKSALMLGLGEELEEVKSSLRDLREHHVDFMTIGQYMKPSKKHLAIKRWVNPEEFEYIANYSRKIGFQSVASSPLVRSSYKAYDFYLEAMKNKGDSKDHDRKDN